MTTQLTSLPSADNRNNNALSRLVSKLREQSRNRRAQIFHHHFELTSDTRILDLGGSDGAHLNALLAGTRIRPENCCVADIDATAVELAADRFGYQPVLLREDAHFPWPDKSYDIVFCSSVLEHVTVDKDEIWSLRSQDIFRRKSLEHQQRFAAELRRVARGYFVQVPHWAFPIEMHTWLPLAALLPRQQLLAVMRCTNRFWIKKSSPDFYLLKMKELAPLFPEASIHVEYSFGIPKSLIAIHGRRRCASCHAFRSRSR